MFTLGFDVAKDHVDVALINKSGQSKDRWQVSNTVPDIAKLLRAVQAKHANLQAGCEATSYYHLATVQACSQVKLACYVLNPLLTKQLTRSSIRNRKTDRDDAIGIARLVLRGEGNLVVLNKQSLAKTYGRLATKVRQQQQAVGLQEHFLGAMHEALGIVMESPFVDARDTLGELVTTFRDMTARLVDQEQLTLLQSIPGVGPVVAVTLVAELGDLQRFPGAKQLIAFIGLDPKVRQSGKVLNRNTRLTKRGAPELRRALFLAANVARQHDPELAAYYQKKRNEGKTYTAATVATARKLCCRIYAIMERGTPYVKSS
jgi:transposase